MMSTVRIGISMRMERIAETGEVRNALAHDWTKYMAHFLPLVTWLPVPNMGGAVVEWVESMGIGGLIFSGGDDWGRFSQRDETEKALWRWARGKGLPVLGVCRGMQVLNFCMGGSLPSPNAMRDTCDHVATRHGLILDDEPHEVNSYHNGLLRDKDIAPRFKVWGKASDGTVEAIRTPDHRMYGIMWHPEREAEPSPLDMAIMKRVFG